MLRLPTLKSTFGSFGATFPVVVVAAAAVAGVAAGAGAVAFVAVAAFGVQLLLAAVVGTGCSRVLGMALALGLVFWPSFLPLLPPIVPV